MQLKLSVISVFLFDNNVSPWACVSSLNLQCLAECQVHGYQLVFKGHLTLTDELWKDQSR